MAEESDHLEAGDGMVMDLEVELLGESDSTDHGEVIVREPVPQDGRLAYWGVGAGDGRQEIEAALIDEEQRSSLPQCLIFLWPASARLATAGWPPRLAASHASPVSESSNPSSLATCSRARGGT